MFTSSLGNGLSLAKILTGISKALNIANQAIPLVKDFKPIISNARSFISGITNQQQNIPENKTTNKTNNTKKAETNLANPVFFH